MRAPSAIGLFLLLAATACDTSSSVAPILPDAPDFGDPYEVDDSPILDEGLLLVPVSYSGGCKEHTFDLGFRVVGSTTELWLHHDARGDRCEALVSEVLEVSVPIAAQTPPLRFLLRADTGLPVAVVRR